MIDHSGLDDFLTFEDSPSDSIHIFLANIESVLALRVDGLVSDHIVLVEMGDQWVYQFLRNEELIICFLEHVAVLRTPTVLGIRALGSINLWL